MKNVFLALALLALCKLSWAQEPLKHMLSATYHYSKEINYEDLKFLALYYPIQENLFTDFNYYDINTSYYSYDLPIQYSVFFPKDVFLYVELSGNKSDYKSNYTYYQNDFFDMTTCIENIKGKGGSYSVGLGKAFYLTDDKKIMIMPYLIQYVERYNYVGEGVLYKTSSGYSPLRAFDGHKTTVGFAIGLNANFQLSKHFGLGFKFRNFCKYEGRFSYDTRIDAYESMDGFEFNPRQIPQMHLIYYFETTKSKKK